jgi:histidyl-tRNA synthetase
MANEMISAVRGTREFYPEELAIRSWLYQKLKQISAAFGYQEYDGPFLESLDLYAAKSGEELVKEQSFVFPDRGGNMIALRPELTPSLARMVAQRQRQLAFPLRWWSFGPMWRYERPGKGAPRPNALSSLDDPLKRELTVFVKTTTPNLVRSNLISRL